MTNNRSKILDALFFKGRMHRLNAREMFLANMFGTGAGSGGQLCTVSGTDSIILPKAAKNGVMHLTQTGVVEQNGTPTPNAPVDLVCNNGVISVRHQSGLPIGYKLIEYVEADGAPYALTDYLITSDDVIETEYCNLSESGYGSLYGVYKTGESSAFYANNTYYGYNVTNAKVDTGVSVDTEWHTLVHDFVQGKLTLDGVDTTFEPFTFANTAQNAVFARLYNNAYGYFWKGRCRGWRARRFGAFTCKILPCIRESDSEIGFYDVVSDSFYSNVGSGSFAAGSDVTDPIGIYYEGTDEVLAIDTPIEYDTTRIRAEITSSGRWYGSTGNYYTIRVPVVGGKLYRMKFDSTASGTVGTIFRYGFTDEETIPETSSDYVQLVDYERTSPQSAPDTVVRAPRNAKYIVIQLSGTYYTGFLANFKMYTRQATTAAPLLQIGAAKDTQEFVSGTVVRNCAAIKLDGTEEWQTLSSIHGYFIVINDMKVCNPVEAGLSTHFIGTSAATSDMPDNSIKNTYATVSGSGVLRGAISFRKNDCADVAAWKAFLAAQAAADTPVIVVYPLATPTTEQVAPLHITNAKGDNLTVTATANVDDIPLVGQYKCIGCNITATVTNGTASGATKMYPGDTATVTLTPDTDYSLPSSVTVVGATASYNSTTGVITLTNPVGDVTITATMTTVSYQQDGDALTIYSAPYQQSGDTLTI